MKTKFYWVALLASAALIAQAKAGGHHGGGGGGFAMAAHPAPAFHSASRGNFGGGRFMAPGQRFSSIGMRLPNSFRQQRLIGSNVATNRFDGSRTFGRRETSFDRSRNAFGHRFQSRGPNAAREHVIAQRSANWHRAWDRRHDHWWHGHRCHFGNGFWFIYDVGFYPYDYWYPSDYYPSDYYPDGYDPGVYEDGTDYYGQGAYGSSEQSADSTVAAAQEQLARQGYYRGEIDGICGPETRRAIMRYQSDHGLRVTGALTHN